MAGTRTEIDCLGAVEVPGDCYWGAQDRQGAARPQAESALRHARSAGYAACSTTSATLARFDLR
jgi:fumarate hydratase class II